MPRPQQIKKPEIRPQTTESGASERLAAKRTWRRRHRHLDRRRQIRLEFSKDHKKDAVELPEMPECQNLECQMPDRARDRYRQTGKSTQFTVVKQYESQFGFGQRHAPACLKLKFESTCRQGSATGKQEALPDFGLRGNGLWLGPSAGGRRANRVAYSFEPWPVLFKIFLRRRDWFPDSNSRCGLAAKL
eukprot:scaffold1960_cov242-Pinguiococcus_pyrenoidosus.AAC.18